MDPTACLQRCLDALDDGDQDEAREAAEDLLRWLDNGGFPPEFNNVGVSGSAPITRDSQSAWGKITAYFCLGVTTHMTIKRLGG